jgi:hypothetical protein
MTQREFMESFGIKEDLKEFDIPNNIKTLPIKTFVTMSEKHAINIHIKNLINTYGLESVMENMIGVLNEIHEKR